MKKARVIPMSSACGRRAATLPSPAMNPKRELAPIPPDPKPTKKEIAAYRRKQDGWNWNGGASEEIRLGMADLEWLADKKRKSLTCSGGHSLR
jgi:hypothetical protein